MHLEEGLVVEDDLERAAQGVKIVVETLQALLEAGGGELVERREERAVEGALEREGELRGDGLDGSYRPQAVEHADEAEHRTHETEERHRAGDEVEMSAGVIVELLALDVVRVDDVLGVLVRFLPVLHRD